jgi:hypothetical protein
MIKLEDGLMDRYCLVCTPRSGSFYILKHLSETMNLENGKEWFGRMKKVHYDELRTSPIDVNYTVNENLLTNDEIKKRRMWLYARNNFIIKCMPLQLSNTVENKGMVIEKRMAIAIDILSDYNIIWLINKDKISQFCFRFIAQETSRKGYKGNNKEYSEYNKEKRKTPPQNSFTATKEEFEKFMYIENTTNNLRNYFPNCEEIIYEDFIKGKNIIPNPDYTDIFTNYKEVETWFR